MNVPKPKMHSAYFGLVWQLSADGQRFTRKHFNPIWIQFDTITSGMILENVIGTRLNMDALKTPQSPSQSPLDQLMTFHISIWSCVLRTTFRVWENRHLQIMAQQPPLHF